MEHLSSSSSSSSSSSLIMKVPEVKCRYACGFCNKRFPQISMLSKHEIEHQDSSTSSNKPSSSSSKDSVKCPECSFTCSHLAVFKSHHAVHHGNEKRIICPVLHCNLNFGQRSNLSLHMKTHEKFLREQLNIGNTPTIKNNLNNNNNNSSNNNNYSNSSNNNNSNSSSTNNNNNNNNNTNNNNNNDKTKLYTCSYCDYETSHKESLVSHKKKAHPVSRKNARNTITSPSSTTSSSSSSSSSMTQQQFKCQDCKFTCLDKKKLQSHRRTHRSSAKKFDCHICEKSFERKGHLERHINVHTKKLAGTNGIGAVNKKSRADLDLNAPEDDGASTSSSFSSSSVITIQ